MVVPGMVLQLTGTVIDVADREVSASQTISMSPEIYVWAYADPYYAELGENVVLHFFVSDSWWWWGARSSEESSVANSEISVDVYSRHDGEQETLVFSASATADKSGQGEVVLDLPEEIAAEYKEFIAMIKAETPDGRVGESQVWFQYTVLDFDISVSPERTTSGDEILLTLDLTNKLTGDPEKAKVIVYAYDSDYERIGEAEISLEGTETFPIQLTPLAPEGIYRISAWVTEGYDSSRFGLYRDYGWAETTFYVGDLPELNIIPDRISYHVEDTASVSVEIDASETESILLNNIMSKNILRNLLRSSLIRSQCLCFLRASFAFNCSHPLNTQQVYLQSPPAFSRRDGLDSQRSLDNPFWLSGHRNSRELCL